MQRFKRDLESKLQLKRAELSTHDMTERSRLEQEHDESLASARKEFEKQRDSMRQDHKERMHRWELCPHFYYDVIIVSHLLLYIDCLADFSAPVLLFVAVAFFFIILLFLNITN